MSDDQKQMNTMGLRFGGPQQTLPGMHQPIAIASKHPMHQWVGPIRTPGQFPPPYHLGPPIPPQLPLYFQSNTPAAEWKVHIRSPPMLHLHPHPATSRVHHQRHRPQPPVHHFPPPPPRPLQPPMCQFHRRSHQPMPSKLSPTTTQLLSTSPVNPPLPSAPYPYSTIEQPILPPPATVHDRIFETTKPPGLGIPPLSVQQHTIDNVRPYRCLIEIPKLERPQSEEINPRKKEKQSRNFSSSAFSCDVLDDSDDERDSRTSTNLFDPGTVDFTYRPPPSRDPFANSKSLRHQQPANPRLRDSEDVSENDEDDIEFEDENYEDFLLREEKAYQEILPNVRKLMTKVRLDGNWPSEKEEKSCMICQFPQRLKGWTALLQHAENFKKRRPAQHRAYYRALSEYLKRPPLSDDDSFEEKAVLIDSGKLVEEIIVWPPLVIVTNLKDEAKLETYVPNIASMDVEKTLRETVNGKAGRMLVMFPATEIGLLNAKLLVESLAKLTSSQKFNKCTSTHPVHDSTAGMGHGSSSSSSNSSRKKYLTFRESYPFARPVDDPMFPTGHLAEPADMIDVDPHKKFIHWSAENRRHILKRLTKKSKEEHEREKAKVKAKLVEVDEIAESHQQFKTSKALLSQQLKDAEIALQEQKQLEEYISYKHSEELTMMDAQFKDDMWRFEEERVSREGKIRTLLEWNEQQLMNERLERSKEVEVMKLQFASITQELERQTAAKALDKEREIARRREKTLTLMKQREAQFNEEARDVERNLLEKHEAQKMKLVEDFHELRQGILMEWLEKQAALKASAEKAKQEKEILEREAQKLSTETIKECAVCLMEFSGDIKRALIQPCGHAKVCIECAVDIYRRTKLCPICRVKISSKPKVMPKLYM